MSDKRRLQYIRSLCSKPEPKTVEAKQEPKTVEASSSSSRAVVAHGQQEKSSSGSSRKRHISLIVASGSGEVRVEDRPQLVAESDDVKVDGAVRFTLEGLLAFCDTSEGILSGKTAAEAKTPFRRRPNYNNQKRSFFAKIHDRAKLLE